MNSHTAQIIPPTNTADRNRDGDFSGSPTEESPDMLREFDPGGSSKQHPEDHHHYRR